MTSATPRQHSVLRQALSRHRRAFVVVGLLSAVLNILTLAGSVYMMLVYDSVLPSHGLTTLACLFALLVGAYAFQGGFDLLRGRILGDVASAFEQSLAPTVQHAIGTSALAGRRMSVDGLGPMRNLDSIRTYLAGPGPAVLMDLPWVFLFVGFLAFLHPLLGVVTLAGGAVLVALTLTADRVARAPTQTLSLAASDRNALAEVQLRHIEMLSALGMRGRMLDRWLTANHAFLSAHRRLARDTGTLSGISKIGRMLLQSLILTIGAILVIQGKASGGVIFAASILSGKALAPIDQAIATWRPLVSARQAWRQLGELLDTTPPVAPPAITLPAPHRDVRVEQIHVAPPGARSPTLHGVSFALGAGDGLGIVGPSGAGKTSLGRALIGLWKPGLGEVRFDGAAAAQWGEEALGRSIGYLPQSVELLDGTVAQNIARFDPLATSETVIAAARTAGVHDLIVSLPQGYDTDIGLGGNRLSLGQQQRVALARALYGDPFLVLLDEPNSNLDHEGDRALEGAIQAVRARGGIVVLISHRPSLLASVNLALFLRHGRVQAFGPCADVLPQLAGRPAPAATPAPAPASVPAIATPLIERCLDAQRRAANG